MRKILNSRMLTERRRTLRKAMPPAERMLWVKLRSGQLEGWKFRRQVSVGSYILDFYCPRATLGIELDGETHYIGDREQYDHRRQRFIEAFGITVIRFLNTEVYENLEGVATIISTYLEGDRSSPSSPDPSSGRRGSVTPPARGGDRGGGSDKQ